MNQAAELDRVASKIGSAVIVFAKKRLEGQREFHASDLHEFVGDTVAPASADRILRDMRQKGVIDYTLLSRSESLYHIDGVDPAAAFNAELDYVAAYDDANDDDGYVPRTNAVVEGATEEEFSAGSGGTGFDDPDQKPW